MPDLISQLEQEARTFDFFQAVALLEEYFVSAGKACGPIEQGRVCFGCDPDVCFPASDIARVHRDPDGSVRFLLTFMGLVGVSSPLPRYFSQYVAQHEGSDSVLIDFLDIFSHRAYTLFYEAWRRNQLVPGACNTRAGGAGTSLLSRLSALTGRSTLTPETREKPAAHAGTLAGSCRNAGGLRVLIAGLFGGIPVRVKEWVARWARIPQLRRLGRDTVLGSTAMLGTHILDRSGKFCVIIGPLDKDRFERLLPGTPDALLLRRIITAYTTDPLEFDIEVRLKPAALVPIVLGRDDAALGIAGSCGIAPSDGTQHSVMI